MDTPESEEYLKIIRNLRNTLTIVSGFLFALKNIPLPEDYIEYYDSTVASVRGMCKMIGMDK